MSNADGARQSAGKDVSRALPLPLSRARSLSLTNTLPLSRARACARSHRQAKTLAPPSSHKGIRTARRQTVPGFRAPMINTKLSTASRVSHFATHLAHNFAHTLGQAYQARKHPTDRTPRHGIRRAPFSCRVRPSESAGGSVATRRRRPT